MSLSMKPVYRARRFISSRYTFDVATDQWSVTDPIKLCSKSHLDPNNCCHVVKCRRRIRKAGPSHPLWVLKCNAHSCWFTVYPLGWLPFGRRILLDLDSMGEAIIAEDCWEETAFGAATHQDEKKVWPATFVELLKLDGEGLCYYATRRTQIRHIHGAAMLLGLSITDNQQRFRMDLGFDYSTYQQACVRIRDGPVAEALGAACTGILRSISQPSILLFAKMVNLGQELGYWGSCANQ